MATDIRSNRNSGRYVGQRPARTSDTRPQSTQTRQRDLTIPDIQRLGQGIDNLIIDITNLFSGPIKTPGTTSDVINERGVLESDTIDSGTVRDQIQLLFDDTTNDNRIQFRATITGITESHNPEWVQHNYIGRPYPIHQYKGVSRTITFDFKVYAMGKNELEAIWRKLNYLTGLTHPASYVGSSGVNGFMTPPYVDLTIGSVFEKIPGFINSLNYTIPDGISWDIDRELPLGIDVNVGYTIIETASHSNADRSSFYGVTDGDIIKGTRGILQSFGELKQAFRDFNGGS